MAAADGSNALALLGEAPDDAPERASTLPEMSGLSVEQLNEWRQDQLNWLNWRYDAYLSEEYVDGNQFSEEDRNEMAANGIPIITINRIQHQINSVVGLQESNITDLKLSAEDPQMIDPAAALNMKLHEAERGSRLRVNTLRAQKSAARVGIGWVEVGRNRNPFKSKYRTDAPNWREMWWDFRAPYGDPEEMTHIRRVKYFSVDRLITAFPQHEEAIRRSAWTMDQYRLYIEPDMQYRQYDKRNTRDVPLTWNQTVPSQQRTMRLLEECWYQVDLEGPVVHLPGDIVIAYEDCCHNPMVQTAIDNGVAEIEYAPYTRWRLSYWINDFRLYDGWSPYPGGGQPYEPIWFAREAATGVPYGMVRVLRSIQDGINTLEGKMMFSINAKQVMFEEGAIDVTTWQQQIGRKNGMLPVKQGFWGKVKVEDHQQLQSMHVELYRDLIQQIETVGGTAGLNPASMTSKPRSGVLAQQMMMQSLAALGDFAGNCRESKICSGRRLLNLVKQDISKTKGNGVPVNVRHRTGRRARVILHQKVGVYEGRDVINNDVTLISMQLDLDETPHTPTYRAAQLESLTTALQSLPTNDPSTLKVRLLLTAKMLECSDIPGALEDAKIIRESMGMAQPETPEEQQQMQMQQEEIQQQKALQMQGALAQIKLTEAKTAEHEAGAQHKAALAAKVTQPDPIEQAQAQTNLEKSQAQVGQIHQKTAHSAAVTELATNQARKTSAEADQARLDSLNPGGGDPQQPPPNW